MNIVLTCLKIFQEYILINIEQLIKLGHQNIYVVTNSHLLDKFDEYKSKINLIDADGLDESYNFNSISSLDSKFRNGFWKLTSLRLFYIYEFMKKYNVANVIHLENDVLIYYNCDELSLLLNKDYMYIPFDTYKRNIASIMYIPDEAIFKKILDEYNFNKNDMENFSIIKQKTGLIQNFPIFVKEFTTTDEEEFVSMNSEIFPYIFDGAAMGQYLGGVDPRNISGDTRGFVNETCIIKYNKYTFLFKELDGINRPYITISNKEIPIFNLHIHSKALDKFV